MPSGAGIRLKRRHLPALLGGAIVALRTAAAAAAQPAHVGFISGGDEQGAADFVAALRDGLAAEGYREPDTLRLDRLYADYSLERVAALVTELDRRRVALIVTHAAAVPIVVKERRRFRSYTNSAPIRSRPALQPIWRIRSSTRPALR